MIDRTWLPWPTHPGFWWFSVGGCEPELTLVDDELDAHRIETDSGWVFRADRNDTRFLDALLVRPEAP